MHGCKAAELTGTPARASVCNQSFIPFMLPAQLQAEARNAAALATNAQQLRERRAAFDEKQAHNEARRWCACVC